jgi:hypothetical protein
VVPPLNLDAVTAFVAQLLVPNKLPVTEPVIADDAVILTAVIPPDVLIPAVLPTNTPLDADIVTALIPSSVDKLPVSV